MNEQNSLEQDVQALRLAAESGDWDSCRSSTQALLIRLPPSHAIRLARDFVARRLAAFERQQPDVHWPRELLEAVTEENPASRKRSWPDDEFPGPGGNSFAKAVDSLWNAGLRRGDARQCTAELVDSLSHSIMAETDEHWGSRHPKEWALWYQLVWADDYDPRMTDLQRAMTSDLEVKRLERAAWLEIAGQLEAALRGG